MMSKQSSASSPSSTVRSFVEGQQQHQQQHQQQQQEDLDAIAKQISDHAEAIYQTWKARGLAPTEILNCQLPTVDGEDAFSRTLSPTSSVAPSPTASPAGAASASTSGVAKLLAQAPELSNNSLEQLVSSFVNEDKARIAAQKQRSPVAGRTAAAGSAIKSVLQKFEQNGAQSSLNTSPVNKPNFIRPGVKQVVNNNNNNNLGTLDKNNVPDVLKDTIVVEKPREKPQTPVKPEHLLNHVPSWPLKNRVVKTPGQQPQQQQQPQQNHHHSSSAPSSGPGSSSSNISSTSGLNSSLISKNTAELMDEVSREEERLINALKTGTVLNNTDGLLPEVITSTLVPDRGDVPDYGYSSSSPGADMVTSSTLMANGNGINGNGTTVVAADGQNNAGGNAAGVKHWNGVPMKPNHIPIMSLHQIHEQQKLSTNFTRNVATTRLPKDFGRGGQQDKKEDFQAKTIPSPIRPFLSRGSVAERVLIFEKCPEKAPPRERAKEPVKVQSKPVNRLIPPNIHTTLQRHLKNSTKAPYIPQFHFPNGKPPAAITTETTMQRLEQVFDSLPNYECSRDKFHKVVTMCQVPLYWRVPLFMCTPLTATGCVNGDKFISFWRQMTSFCHDPASRFVYIMSRGDRTRSFILPEDFAPLIQDVVDTHPGLAFLKEAAEFHSRYVHTVIARIFYSVNRSWTGKITVPELRKSNLLDVMQLLEEEEDINQIMAYFSYEHFYVIYCKFWELDRDHDLFIDQQDLARHNDHALSSRMIERIFSGCVTRGPRRGNANPIVMGPNGPKMSYTDFVWFLLAEEDKTHPTAIEYWFRCMDVDGDGMLSMYELEYFYEEQQHRMESLGIETLPFEDCLCQMLDMIKPTTPGCITLADLKRCKMTPIFFDTFFNLEKYMEHEQRDPFAQRDNDDLSDWDRYAAQEYELLVAEEGGDTQGFGCFAPIDDDDLDDLYGGNGEDGLARKPLPGHGALGTASVSTRGRTVSTVSSARGTTRQHSANTTATANTTKTRSSSKAFSSTKTNQADDEPRRQPKDSSSFFNAFCVSYDEDDDYESNIDILESQLDDCLLNEW
ncbi:uncharacterized protein LOC6033077 isoform X3 [Culex quinquefasciatus]|uniref:uncharacterized protein LOC6033077 isoform X3 n=1 Tax=Culex quinquefasciatus TaxID=7176 RepID=UPI0018E2D883|nr:uncharacterized protein LOC6033077 isoform X3 [Culex quinquefasciatus]XP_038120643.1 uncharacterized protein LOC6033077 isoform X3 [Culex quinquefasciatus]XP_038120644.1 uncharacterized protein LOC6033077 isoform X3 [Culex quinquefasciatus]XP_038120645.1 uncharacterized protein LOC6033077 isoform X3 [Culex quinquefasciatus]